MSKKKMPYGLWPASQSPEQVGNGKRLNDVQWHQGTNELIWEESHSLATSLYSMNANGTFRQILDYHTPKGSVGYGGGTFCADQGEIIFSEKDHRLYRMAGRYQPPMPITPDLGGAASPAVSPDHQWVVYVNSDGKQDVLAAIPLDGSRWPVQLAQGADFYMQPCWHPQSQLLAWVEWDHPQMPWDGTRLMLGHLHTQDALQMMERNHMDGDERHAVRQPQFSPDGRYLSYLLEEEEWDSLILYDFGNAEKTRLVIGDGFHLSEPAWVQGSRSYGWSGDSQHISFFKIRGSFVTLWQVDVATGRQTQIPTEPYTCLEQISVSQMTDEIALIASSSCYPARIMKWNGREWTIVTYATTDLMHPQSLPEAQEVCWKAPDGTQVYGLYYAPKNSDWEDEGLPPAIISIHGGPTSCAMATYSSMAAYFTSRGYAWLDVNHRGSTGFGRTYREYLNGNWGVVDVEDAVGGAQMLAEQRLADGNRLVIRGGSAGGYTVLNALTNYAGVFAAGISLYGISNLFALAVDTHKFEAHYQDTLLGPLPQAAGKYRARSAIFRADQIRDPLMIFQGNQDTVVPPNQSELIVAEIKKSGVPYLYQVYEGEGHGFRKNENLVDMIQQIERFLMQHVLFNNKT